MADFETLVKQAQLLGLDEEGIADYIKEERAREREERARERDLQRLEMETKKKERDRLLKEKRISPEQAEFRS